MAKKESKLGRPTKLDPERTERIVLLLRAGNYVETAAAMAGINKTTLYDWLKRGARAAERDEQGLEVPDEERPFIDFSNAVEKAMAEGEAFHLAVIAKAGDQGVWQASAWMLERRYPDRFGRRERIEHTGPGGGPVEVDVSDVRARVTRRLDSIAARLTEAGGAEGSDGPGAAGA